MQSEQKAIRQSRRSSEKETRVQVKGPLRTYIVERLTWAWGWGNGEYPASPSGKEALDWVQMSLVSCPRTFLSLGRVEEGLDAKDLKEGFG